MKNKICSKKRIIVGNDILVTTKALIYKNLAKYLKNIVVNNIFISELKK